MKRQHTTHRRLGRLLPALALALALPAGAAARAQTGDTPASSLDAKCELGITLALAGQTASAESVFISLLSDAPADPRSYVNLGNVHFLRGDLDVALVFYDMAAGRDSADAGIHLNRATTLMMKGENEAARIEAQRAVELAGGPEAASALVGLKGPESGKAAEKAYVSKQEVRDLLSGAMLPPPAEAKGSAAADSLRTDEVGAEVKKRSRVWGSAAPRASDNTDAAAVLYWKY